MDWKKKLMLATGAFVSMPAAVSAHEPLGLRRIGSLRRRTSTVPFTYDPAEGQSIRVNVRVPINKARRVLTNQIRRASGRTLVRCNSYRVEAALIKMDGEYLKLSSPYIKGEEYIKLASSELAAGGGTTIVLDTVETQEPVTITARVEVTPIDSERCYSEPALTSVTLNTEQGREFLPSKELEPVILKQVLNAPIIIKDPIFKDPEIIIP